MGRSESGFTLVEILVATVILFLAIATLSGVINSARLSNIKVNERMLLHAQIPAIIDEIELVILTGPDQPTLSGRGKALNIDYQWSATTAESGTAVGVQNSETGNLSEGSNFYRLYQVNLTLQMQNIQKQYQFMVTNWKVDESAIQE